MEQLIDFYNNQPKELGHWFEQFPWDLFEPEITVLEDDDAEIIIARRVLLEPEAEVSKIVICHDAEIGQNAEIKGTLACYCANIAPNAEINYLIARSVDIQTDAEVQSALILDSLKLELGVEIGTLEILDYTFMDFHQASIIKNTKKHDTTLFSQLVEERLNILLDAVISEG